MRQVYTTEQIEFLRQIAKGKYAPEITQLFNEKFNTNLTEKQIKALKKNHHITSDVPKRSPMQGSYLFSTKEIEWLKEHHIGLTSPQLAERFNKTFNRSITARQIKAWRNRHHLSSGLKGSEGMDPPNKGTKGLYNVGGNKTSFKKGQTPLNYKPVGTERIDRDGYILVKVSDTGAWHERWRHKHKVVWEQVHGPIPPGHVLLFADTNRQNVSVDNLILITKNQLARMNQNKLRYEDPELTKTGLTIADIYCKIGKLKQKKKDMAH